MASLAKRLENYLEENPKEYSKSCVERVRKLVLYETEKPRKKKPYRFLEKKEDFMLYFYLHPEWNGYSVADAIKDKESRASAFYGSFNQLICCQIKNKRERRMLMQEIFTPKLNDWSSFTKIDDWKRELNRHPEWKGYSTEDAVKDKESGAYAYHQAFRKWVYKQTKDKEERRKIVQEIFSKKRRNWSSFTKIDDWKRELNRHPEWKGYSTEDARKDKKNKVSAYYWAFKKWIYKQTKDKEERKKLMQEIFPYKNNHKIKSSSQLIEAVNTEPKARYAIEKAVGLSDPKEIDVTVADVLAVVWDGRIERKDIIKMLQEPSLARYLGNFARGGKSLVELSDIIDAGKALLPYDKDNMIRQLIKRRVERWLYDEYLSAKPAKKEIYSALEKITEQIDKLEMS